MPDYCGLCHEELDAFCEECQGWYCQPCEARCSYCDFWDEQESQDAQDWQEEPAGGRD
jgi:hypothetical protein